MKPPSLEDFDHHSAVAFPLQSPPGKSPSSPSKRPGWST